MSFSTKFSKFVVAAITASVLASTIITPVAEAKSFGGSRSFSSSSFSRSSFSSSRSSSRTSGSFWGSSSRTSSTPKAIATSSSAFYKSQSTSTKPSSSMKTNVTPQKKTFSHVGSGTGTMQAKAALNSQRTRFTKTAYVPKTMNSTSGGSTTAYRTTYSRNPVYASASGSDRRSYYDRRNRYYSNYTAPTYVYSGSPSYGLWDTIFLYSMLNNMNNASSFAYNHYNDPDYLAWRREADRQAQTNADLRAELASLDTKVNTMNGARDPSYLPKGVDADIALSQEALNSQKPSFRACVGSKSGAYYRIVSIMLRGQNVVDMTPVITAGSRETLEKIANGECDGGFVQSDSYWNYVENNKTADLPFSRVFSPYKESVHLVCNVNSKVRSLDDLNNRNNIYFPRKSGAAETWSNIVAENSKYKSVRTSLTDDKLNVDFIQDAFVKAGQDKNGCAMYVVAPNATTIMRQIEAGAKASNLVLVNVEDKNVMGTKDPSGMKVYTDGNITRSMYPNLLRKAGMFGFFSGDVNTMNVNADFIISDDWKKKNRTSYPELTTSLMGMTGDIQRAVHQ